MVLNEFLLFKRHISQKQENVMHLFEDIYKTMISWEGVVKVASKVSLKY